MKRITEVLIRFRGHAGLKRISLVDVRVSLEIPGFRIQVRERPLVESRSES